MKAEVTPANEIIYTIRDARRAPLGFLVIVRHDGAAYVGVSVRNPKDAWSPKVGKAIAMHRATALSSSGDGRVEERLRARGFARVYGATGTNGEVLRVVAPWAVAEATRHFPVLADAVVAFRSKREA